jgi:hypothetical protein
MWRRSAPHARGDQGCSLYDRHADPTEEIAHLKLLSGWVEHPGTPPG